MSAPDGLKAAAKSPTDVVEYTITFDGLGADAISTFAVVGTGLTVLSSPAPSHTATTGIVWVSGGALGAYGVLEITITTTGGRTFKRRLVILIEDL